MERKLKVLRSFGSEGVVATMEKYNLSAPTLYRWREVHEREGEQGLHRVNLWMDSKRLRELKMNFYFLIGIDKKMDNTIRHLDKKIDSLKGS